MFGIDLSQSQTSFLVQSMTGCRPSRKREALEITALLGVATSTAAVAVVVSSGSSIGLKAQLAAYLAPTAALLDRLCIDVCTKLLGHLVQLRPATVALNRAPIGAAHAY